MDVNDEWVFLLSCTQVTLDSLGGSTDKLEVSMHLAREEKINGSEHLKVH